MTGSRSLAAALASLVIATAGCAGASSGEPSARHVNGTTPAMVTIAEALEMPAGTTVTVRGYVLETGGTTVLAEMLAESYPPQPGGAQLVLEGLDVADIDGTETAGDTTWTDDQHSVTGVLQEATLRVR